MAPGLPAYDTCQIPFWKIDERIDKTESDTIMAELLAFCVNGGTCTKGTEWTATFAYNAVIILMSACNICVLMMGASYWVPRYWGTLINCCCACFSMGGWIAALARRYSPVG